MYLTGIFNIDKIVTNDKKYKLIICIILSLSVFTAHLPINTGGRLFIIVTFIQMFLFIIINCIIKELKNYCICICSLMVSNIISSIYTWIWTQLKIQEIQESFTNDLLYVFVIAGYGLFAYLSIATTIIVCLECGTSLLVKLKKHNKIKSQEQKHNT